MLMWQGLKKTCIGIYFIDQIWMIKTEYLGWSTLKSNYYQTLIDFEFFFFFSLRGSIRGILQLSCLKIWILFTQEYIMAFWMKTITKSNRFYWSLYVWQSSSIFSFSNVNWSEFFEVLIILKRFTSIWI
jgi:hypothetical protein